MKYFLIALQFLTIIPVKISSDIKEEDYGKALLYFPVVGALIGIFLAACLFLFSWFPRLASSALILVISSVITGGIHLDGFADTCDGLYGFRSKEKALEIMRDSRIGAIGVIGIVLLLILKFSLMASFPELALWKALIMMMAFSRWAQVLGCFMSTYARTEGKGKYFIDYDSKKEFILTTLFTAVLFLVMAHFNGLAILALSFVPTIFFIAYIRKKLGGMTGDTIGAASEIAEVSALLTALVYLGK